MPCSLEDDGSDLASIFTRRPETDGDIGGEGGSRLVPIPEEDDETIDMDRDLILGLFPMENKLRDRVVESR
jgi:hypothetical protein